MSTSVEIEDPDSLTSALAAVRSDVGTLIRQSWALIGHVNHNPNLIHVVNYDNSPTAQISSFVSQLQDDMVMYGLLRHAVTVDMSPTVKFIYVHWIGPKVAGAKKGRYGVVHGSVKEHIGDYHLTIETSSPEDLNLDQITKQLEESSGVRNKVLESNEHGLPERGFTQHQVRDSKKTVNTIATPTGVLVKVSKEVTDAIHDVQDDSNPTMWVVASYEDGDVKKQLVKVDQGVGDSKVIQDILKDDVVLYVLYRRTEVVHEVTTVKFIYIVWVGENVKPLAKGKVSTQKSALKDIFKPAHITLYLSDKLDLTESNITRALGTSG